MQGSKQQTLQSAKEPPLEKKIPYTHRWIQVECEVMMDLLTEAFERERRMSMFSDELIWIGDPAMSIGVDTPSPPFSMSEPFDTSTLAVHGASTDEIMAAAHREANKHIPSFL